MKRAWGNIQWFSELPMVEQLLAAIAVFISLSMDNVKQNHYIGYILGVIIVASCVLGIEFVQKGNALMSFAMGGIFIGSLLFSVFYIAWKRLT